VFIGGGAFTAIVEPTILKKIASSSDNEPENAEPSLIVTAILATKVLAAEPQQREKSACVVS
jgi:hypothetical protein